MAIYAIGGGLSMLAILVMIGPRYACYVDNRGDQTCLPTQFCSGPGMPAFLIGTIIFKIVNPFPIKHVHFRSNLIGGNDEQ